MVQSIIKDQGELMRYKLIFYCVISVMLILTCCSDGQIMPENKERDDAEYASAHYLSVEMTEITKILLVLEGVSGSNLRKRMDTLSIYHKVLLGAWVCTTREHTIDVSNLWPFEGLNIFENYNSTYKTFIDAMEYAIFWRGDIRRKEEGADYKLKSEKYYDSFCQTVLEIVSQYITKGRCSLAFAKEALMLACWLRQSEGGKLKSYDEINRLMGETKNVSLRRRLFTALYEMNYQKEETSERYVNDSDVWIAHRSARWLVNTGNKEYLPKYIRLCWVLYGAKSAKNDETELPWFNMSPENFLSEFIPSSGRLFSFESQTRWLENNFDNLVWVSSNTDLGVVSQYSTIGMETNNLSDGK